MYPGALRITALGGLIAILFAASFSAPSRAATLPPPEGLLKGARSSPLLWQHSAATMREARSSPGRWAQHSLAERLAAARDAGGATGTLTALGIPGGSYVALDDYRDGGSDIYLFKLTSSGALAPGWPANGLPVCTAPGYQITQELIPDGSGGVIVGWADYRDAWNQFDAYAQRVTSVGGMVWAANGIKILSGDQILTASVASDGTGGVLLAWTAQGATDTDVFATRRDGSGSIAPGWSASGTPVCTAAGDQSEVSIVAAGSGGAIVTWGDQNGDRVDAQKFNGTGVAQWTPNGIRVDDASGYPTMPAAASDGTGGAYVFWSDTYVIKGQHLDGAGTRTWATAGVDVVSVQVMPSDIVAIEDGLGGAIVHFSNYFEVNEVRAQRVNAAGGLEWGVGGAQVISPSSFTLGVVADGTGGAMFAWDSYDGTTGESDIRAQKVGPIGDLQWTAGGVPVCAAEGDQSGAAIATDGAGGLVVAWRDARGAGNDVYCQHLDSAGTPQLAANGVALYSDPGAQTCSATVPDGAGGAFIVWRDWPHGDYDIHARHYNAAGSALGPSIVVAAEVGTDMLEQAVPDGAGGVMVVWIHEHQGQSLIYAQKFDASLNPQWTSGGVAVCDEAGSRRGARLIADGTGGAIVTWADSRAGGDGIYARRIDPSGVPQWATGGIAMCGVTYPPSSPAIVADGAGGAIVTWTNSRQPGCGLYGQRVNAAGNLLWTAYGIVLAELITPSAQVGAVSDGAGGAIVFAHDWRPDLFTYRNMGDRLIVQRVNASGAPQWGDSGAVVCDVGSPVWAPGLTTASGGGAIVAWSDGRNGPFDIRAQRFDGSGAAQWAAGGAVVCDAASWQWIGGMVPDGSGGAVLLWSDERGGLADVYAQRVNSAGAAQWAGNGALVCGASAGQFLPTAAADGSGNTIVSWTDDRSSPTRFIYTQRLSSSGAPTWTLDGIVPVQLSLSSATADADGVHLRWWAAERVTATVYRRTATGAWAAQGTAASDGTGLITWHDRQVAAGERYGYRLGITEAGRETFVGEAWVNVPATLALAIEGARPNPIRGEFTVAFALPAPASATLEVFDLSGRLVQRTALENLPAGRHVRQLEAPPGAGLYFLRLTQSGRSVTARAVVAP